MADLLYDFPIKASAQDVFHAVTSPSGLDAWWTRSSAGVAELGGDYELKFGPGYEWLARVSKCARGSEFELELIQADDDWIGTRIGFELEERGLTTQVRFSHRGWPEVNEHFRISSYCWAMYLRLLKRFIELGDVVAYEKRLDA